MSLVSTSGVRGPVGEAVTERLAAGIGRTLAHDGADRVVVGRDARPSSERLIGALAAGAAQGGTAVIDVGLVATPTLARAVPWYNGDAGVMVTASHNPPRDNGFKFWDEDGIVFRRDRVASIVSAARAKDRAIDPNISVANRDNQDAQDRHVAAIAESTPRLEGTAVVVDIGNGAGGVTATALRERGARVIPLYARPDGRFPNRPSEPTAANCTTLQRRVANTGADLGVALDGDADRLLAVTEDGDPLAGDALLSILARQTVSPGGTVVVSINTSHTVERTLVEAGITVERTSVGDPTVIRHALATGAGFAGEPSGGFIWPDAHPVPDGPMAACRLAGIVERSGPLSAIAGSHETGTVRRCNLESADKGAHVAAVADRLTDRYEDWQRTNDGIRVTLPDGWLLIRASGTEPLLRITAEAATPERTTILLERARAHVRAAAPS